MNKTSSPSTNRVARQAFVAWLRRQIGLPYRWSGSGPDAWDCSGLMVAGLQHVGLLPNGVDMTADGLRRHLLRLGCPPMQQPSAPGQLLYYGKTRHSPTEHVMAVLCMWTGNWGTLVGARGGDSFTTTMGAAFRAAAFVDVVLSDYWSDGLQMVLDPFDLRREVS